MAETIDLSQPENKPKKPRRLARIWNVARKAGAVTEAAAVGVVGVATMDAGVAMASSGVHEGAKTTLVGEAANPISVANKVINSMNNDPHSPYPNQVVSEVFLFGPGSVSTSGPVVAAEHMSGHGTVKLKANQYNVVEFGRRVNIGGHKWLVGYTDPSNGTSSAIDTAHMRWYDLSTTKFQRFGFPDPTRPRDYLAPQLFPVEMDPDANLRLKGGLSFTTLPDVMPPVLTADYELNQTGPQVHSWLQSQGFKPIPANQKLL